MNADTKLVMEALTGYLEELVQRPPENYPKFYAVKKLLQRFEKSQAGVFHRNDLQLEGFPYPVKELENFVPCVLYFENQQECDEFQRMVREAKPEFTKIDLP